MNGEQLARLKDLERQAVDLISQMRDQIPMAQNLAWDDPLVNAVRGLCVEILEAARADGCGGCLLCMG